MSVVGKLLYTDILLSKNDNGTNIGQGIVFFRTGKPKKKGHIKTAPHFEKENAMPKFLRGSSPTPTNVWAKNLGRSFFGCAKLFSKNHIHSWNIPTKKKYIYKYISYIYNPPQVPTFLFRNIAKKLSGELLLMDKHPAPPDMYETLHKNGHLPYQLVQDFFHQQYWSEYVLFQLMVNWWFESRWFGFLGSPYERDCYLGASLESQTTNEPLAAPGISLVSWIISICVSKWEKWVWDTLKLTVGPRIWMVGIRSFAFGALGLFSELLLLFS